MGNLIILIIAALGFAGFYAVSRYFVAMDMRLKAEGLPLRSPRRVSVSTLILLSGLAMILTTICFFLTTIYFFVQLYSLVLAQ